jgi:hypothetical protein
LNGEANLAEFAHTRRYAIDGPIEMRRDLRIGRVREEPERIENLLLLCAEVLGGECVCVERCVLDHVFNWEQAQKKVLSLFSE